MIVPVEANEFGEAVRIFNSTKEAFASGLPLTLMLRSLAVEQIRNQVFKREEFSCQHCGKPITKFSGEMHERQWRGRGGEVSVDNSVALCNHCHQMDKVAGHGKRQPRFGESVL